jgi:hypothetical protein
VFAGRGSYASAQAFSAGFGPALGICAALALAAAIAGLLAPARPDTSRPAAAAAGTTDTTGSGLSAGEPPRQPSEGQTHDHDPVQR